MPRLSKVSMIFVDIAAVVLVACLVVVVVKKTQTPATSPQSAPNTIVTALTPTIATSTISKNNADPAYTISVSYPELSGSPEFNALSKKIAQLEVATFDGDSLDPAVGIPGLKFYFDGSFTIPLITSRIVSIEYDFDTFSGGAHPNNYQRSVVYDLKNTSQISLADLFQPQSSYLQKISDLSRSELQKILQNDAISDEGLRPETENFDQFLLTKNGLTILFSPYQVASYADGPQRVTIPFEKINDMFSDYGKEIISAHLQVL